MNINSAIMRRDEKRFLFIINTAGQAYTWQPLIRYFLSKGYAIKILARDQGHTIEVLQAYGMPYSAFGTTGSRCTRLLGGLSHLQKVYKLSKDFNPSTFVGFGVDTAITAARLGKRCILFIDDEPTPIQNRLAGLLSDAIITPQCFKTNLGRKHVRVEGYKELAYLHLNYFKPDISVFDELGIGKTEKYIIIRLGAFNAIHDIGKHGFSVSDQVNMLEELKKYARVFISPEGSLAKELESYRLPTAYNRIHHALYYAQLLVTDTQTMTTEAAVLGTPVVRCNNFVGPNDMSNFIELEHKYDLIYSFQKYEQAIQKAFELIKQPDLKTQWARKRQKLIADKIDVTQFLVDFIANYPESFFKYKERNNIRG